MFGFPGISDRGHATAEYAVGTVGAACIGCVLYQLGDGEWFIDLIQQILNQIKYLAVRSPLIPGNGIF